MLKGEGVLQELDVIPKQRGKSDAGIIAIRPRHDDGLNIGGTRPVEGNEPSIDFPHQRIPIAQGAKVYETPGEQICQIA